MYKAARDVHTNGIHNTYTSKGRGKMNHIKQFFREKGLYLFCLAMVFAATAAGILALRTVVSNVADLTRTRKEALQNDSAWTQPDTAIDKPAQDVPKPTTTPAATEKPSATPAPAAAQAPKATAAPPAQTVTKPGIWDAKPLAAFSGNELVYSATLGDWRTHNGADYAAPAGESVTAAKAGKGTNVTPKNNFKDVNAKTPHVADIQWLAGAGVTEGWKVGNSYEFRGMNNVVRQDMAAFLHHLNDKVLAR